MDEIDTNRDAVAGGSGMNAVDDVNMDALDEDSNADSDSDFSEENDSGSDMAVLDEGSASDEYESELEDDLVYDPTWQPNNTIGMRVIPFTRVNRLLVPKPGGNRPFDWFMLMMDDILLESIVSCTNNYAWEVFGAPTLTPKSRINKWKDVTVEELKTFIGLVIHMGSVRINRLNDYWRTSRYFNFGFVRDYMSRDRFLIILRCLHFSKHDTERVPNDRLHKIRLLIDHFNTKMGNIYYPCRELSLDEGTMLWRGRLIFRQYIKGKRHKYGIKIYSLCEPGGLCISFTVYSGKGGELGGKGHATKVVNYLMNHKLNVGHALFMDNYYNSFPLAAQLLANGTYCTGTLRANRKYLPIDVKDARLAKGEKIERYAEGVMVGKWRDKRHVMYISTEFTNEMVISVNKRGQPRDKPLPIVHYNAEMKGVDRHDQMMSYYPTEHKSLRWYKKLFIHFLQMSMINSYRLYQFANNKPKKSLYSFRLQVLDELLPPKLGPPPQVTKQNANVRHILSKIMKRSSDGKRVQRRKCQMCTKQGKKNVCSVFYCAQCPKEPALCALACFDNWHAQ